MVRLWGKIQASGASKADLNAGIDAAFEAVASVHRLMSFHEPDSDVSRLNRLASVHPVSVDPWTYEVLRIAVELHFRSRGAFDITIAPDLQALGLLPGLGEGSRDVPEARSANQVELLGDKMVRFAGPGIRIDLGGIAKGFAVDRALDALRGFGIVNGLVNAGGDLYRHLGRRRRRFPFATRSIRKALCAASASRTRRWRHRRAGLIPFDRMKR